MFVIRSSQGNYKIDPRQCVSDSSDLGPSVREGEFDGVMLLDIAADEVSNSGWALPRGYTRIDSTQLSLPNPYEVGAGYEMYRIELADSTLDIYHCDPSCFGLKLGKCGHRLSTYASYNGTVIQFCENVFRDQVDLRFVLAKLVDKQGLVPTTKDSCIGHTLEDLGSVSIRYKRPWNEIDKYFLSEVGF